MTDLFPPNHGDAKTSVPLAAIPTSSTTPTPDAGADDDRFNPAKLRLSQDFASAIGVKRLRTTVQVRKPAKEWWIQTHPDPDYRFETAVIELKEDRETYLVKQELWPELVGESTFSARLLVTAVNTAGVVFIWPIRLPGSDGRIDSWNKSATEAVDLASKGQWIRVQSNMSLGAYEVSLSKLSHTPIWPKESLQDLLGIAFRDHYIETLDHPVLRRLRGEA